METSLESERNYSRSEALRKSSQPEVKIAGDLSAHSEILTDDAIRFLIGLHQLFGATRKTLLDRRAFVQQRLNDGNLPDFLPETRAVRESNWKIASIPDDIRDRRVEITGPAEQKMIINALNSGAQVFMADLEDSHSPTWEGSVKAQLYLRDAVKKTLSFTSAEGKYYSIVENPAVLFVRPRGWHLFERNFLIQGQPISASLFDFGLYFFHNVHELLRQGKGPYFYLPKMESHLEARLWNDVFVYAQKSLGVPQGAIRATVLIETVLAAFEMDEILYELREHSAGLNCGRWDYIFSFIKKFSKYADFVLPDRASVTMEAHFLKSYCQLLVQTCHRRGAHAMGGMAAQIPIKDDPVANTQAIDKVTADKKREVLLGHDGTWVAHPGLVPVARKVFDEYMKTPNQIDLPRAPVSITAADLLDVPRGEITEKGLKTNLHISLVYLESWLRGVGCVPIHHLMEDAATAEISRAQIWQWLRYGKIKREDVDRILAEEMKQFEGQGQYDLASRILSENIGSHEFVEFLTQQAYCYL